MLIFRKHLTYTRLSPTRHSVVLEARGSYWFEFETDRNMVPVKQLRNPFAGIRYWRARIGCFRLGWRW